MSIVKRVDTQRVDFVAPNGERIRRSTGSEQKELAQKYHDGLKVELWRVHRLGERMRHTWSEAVVRWLKEQSYKAVIETDKIHLRWLDRFLKNLYLDAINHDLVNRITDVK